MTTIAKDSWNDFLKSLGSASAPEGFNILELFDAQETLDRARKKYKKSEIDALLKLYLSQVDLITLRDKINSNRKNIERGFGRDRLNHLKLLVNLLIMDEEKKPKRGLLAS